MFVQLNQFCPSLQLTTKFLSKHCIKRILVTEMNGYHALFQFYRKTFLRSLDPKQPKTSNFHFDLSLKLSQGEVHDFSREVQKILRGGAKRSQGRCAPPHTSPQNPPMFVCISFHPLLSCYHCYPRMVICCLISSMFMLLGIFESYFTLHLMIS
jgi:hypothetical protein